MSANAAFPCSARDPRIMLLLVAFGLGTLAPRSALAGPGLISFAPHVDYPAGNAPYAVAPADFNGDGKLDLAVPSFANSSVAILLGDGAGGFGPPVNYPLGGTSIFVATGDLNGDGKIDLVAADYLSASVSVLLGNGDGTFGSKTDYPVGNSPFSVAIGDLDGDGRGDLVVTAEGDNVVSVLMGNGDGTFRPRTTFPTATSPTMALIRDLNGDGRLDLAVVCHASFAISVLLGNGSGSFAPKHDFSAGEYPWAGAVGDFDNDGKPDLVASNIYNSKVSVLPGNGDGTFRAPAAVPTGSGPAGIAVGDLNLDGMLDVVVTASNAASVSVLLGDGGGSFVAPLNLPVGNTPPWVAIGDFNRDGFPDLVTANQASNTISVLIQSTPLPHTSTALASDPNPSVFGQPVALTATVTPASATGTVSFYDAGASLGTVALAGGTASLTIANLTAGTHSLTATYGGDLAFQGSLSPPLTQVVNRAGTTTSLLGSPNPSIFSLPVTFAASVAATPPGAGTPAGTVQFRVDGANFGAPVSLAGGQASISTSALAVGSYIVRALYSGDANFNSSSSDPWSQTVTSPGPKIVAVRDVPNDQGGRVFLTWRCPLDSPGLKVVTGYRVWRRAPDPGAKAARAHPGGAGAIEKDDQILVLRTRLPDSRVQESFWEAIANLPAEQLVSYAFTAPTTQDSIGGSNPLTAFFVTALTADPFVYFQSLPDSGYSVDNLAPPTPAPFTASYGVSATTLHWSASPALDVSEFHLHRGLTIDFVPGPANLILAALDTVFVDPVRTPYFYKLAAVDIHGNRSHYALVTPTAPVATLASVVDVAVGPRRILVTWYAGNSGLPVTVYRRTAATAWVALGAIVADGSGYLRYEDLAVETLGRYGYRLGIMDGGTEVFAGETWAVAEAHEFALEGARPNPASGSSLTVVFSLPGAEPARLELIDVGGRRMVAREVGSLGPGRHSVDLGSATHISPGVYLIRLSMGGHNRVTRVTVLD